MSFGALTARKLCLIEVHAGGLIGRGETWVNHPSWAPVERIATLTAGVSPLLIGADAADVAGTVGRLLAALLPLGRQWGAPGPIWQAISGVDVALWDLAGQMAGRSIAALLAERPLARVPVYASGIGPTDVEVLTERALAGGFRAVKVKVGFGTDADRRTLDQVRAVAGSSVRLFADANRAWGFDEAHQMCGLLADHGVEWCEEPLTEDSPEEMQRLFEATGMPLALGENVYGMAEAMRYVECPAVAHFQPDVSKTGGISLASKIGSRAREWATYLSPHCYGSAVTVLATVQLAAASDALGWVELDVRDNPLRTEILARPLELTDGALGVPRGPGLGAGLDEDVLTSYEVVR